MKYTYDIVGLDCADCARKIESELSKNLSFKNVKVNFGASTLVFYSDDDISAFEINRIIKRVEPSSYVTSSVRVSLKKYQMFIPIVALFFGGLGFYLDFSLFLKVIFIGLSYVLLLYKPFVNAVLMFIRSHSINENALICISCIGAICVSQALEGMMVAFLYAIGKILEEKAINNTRTSIKSLLEIKQDYANVKVGSTLKKIDVYDIKVGDILVVKRGEKVPVDGVLKEGVAKLDMSSLTGESYLYNATLGDKILSGSINEGDAFVLCATEIYENSTTSRILDLAMNAGDKKAKTETFVTKFSKVYTPIVLVLAILTTFLLPVFGVSFDDSLYRGLTFLVIACPCAIAISVPLSYFTGIGSASRNGILIKGSNYLDNLVHLKRIIFDKTGTLTTGFFEVSDVEVLDDSYSKDEIIKIVAFGESLSFHPIAKSILNIYDGVIDPGMVQDFKEISGKGISYKFKGKSVKIGTNKICKGCKVDTNLHVNIDGKHVASISLSDCIKKSAFELVSRLSEMGISTMMFTGDRKDAAVSVSKKLKLSDVKYEMLPEDKFKEYEKVSSDGKLTAFVGDGINDAPVIKRADVGISMGAIGTPSAIEASDVVIMSDDLMKIIKSIDISKYTNYIIKQNLVFAIGVKIIILVLSVFGLTTMWFAVFADTGVTLITIFNTLRIRNKFK
ncbi:MAG: heavy metal translocating P-type ATPase [Bacilli bacterium]